METVKLSTFDRLINIHQSLELHQTKNINQKILHEQILQNAQIRYLNNQVSAANEISRLILQNQIKEIKEKEEQKFFKALSFQMHELIEPIDNISDPLVKKYFIDRYYEKIKSNLLQANDVLDEINDKSFNKTTLKKTNEIKDTTAKYSNEYNLSPFKNLDTIVQEIKHRREEISTFKQPQYFDAIIKDKPKENILRIIGMIITGIPLLMILLALTLNLVSNEQTPPPIIGLITISVFFLVPFIIMLRNELKWRKGYLQYSITQNQNRQIECNRKTSIFKKYEGELVARENALLSDPNFMTYQGIIDSYPEFEIKVTELSELENNFVATKEKISAK